jgi:hypothetical protein
LQGQGLLLKAKGSGSGPCTGVVVTSGATDGGGWGRDNEAERRLQSTEGGLWRVREDIRGLYWENLGREAAATFLPVHCHAGAIGARG